MRIVTTFALILILVASDAMAGWGEGDSGDTAAGFGGHGSSIHSGSTRDRMGTGTNCFFCSGNPTSLGGKNGSGSGGTAGGGGGFWSGSGNGGWGWD